MYDASNRKDIRKAEKLYQVREDQRIQYLVASMSTMQGRRYFYHLLEICHIFNDPFSGDALREAYSKGERNIGLYIYGDIVRYCPNDFVTMMREAEIEQELDHGRRDNSIPSADLDPDDIDDPASSQYN